MAAENPSVDVKLIHNHIFQVGKKLLPLGVMGQDAGVQHVGVGDHHVALLADGLPGIVRCVPIIGESLDVCFEFTDESMYLCHLVVGQGLRGEKIDGSGLWFFEDPLEHGDVIAQGLTAGCWRDQNHVLTLMNQLYGTGLVAIKFCDASLGKDLL